MARKPYTVKLRSSVTRKLTPGGTSSTTILDASQASEVADGISRRKPTGWLSPTGYLMRFERYERARGTVLQEIFNSPSNPTPYYSSTAYSGCIGGGAGVSWDNSLNSFDEAFILGGHPMSLYDQALVRARMKMKSQSPNLGVAFAERNKTARLVGDTATQIAKSIRRLRRGDWSGAAKALGIGNPRKPRGSSVTSRWLEYQYGWRPLLSDVYDSSHALAQRDASDWSVTGKGSAVDRIDISYEKRYQFSDYWDCRVAGLQGCFVRIDAIPENDLLLSFSASGITNPLVIGWELVPFSFVLDWFLPVADWLDSLDAMLGYGPATCSISQLQKCSWQLASGPVNLDTTDANFWQRFSGSYRGSKKVVNLDRSVSNDVPLPSMPRLKDPRSLGHMANGLALLASALGR